MLSAQPLGDIPTIGSLDASAALVVQGDDFMLTANDVADSTGDECSEQDQAAAAEPAAPESADTIEIELAPEDAPETPSTEDDTPPSTEEDLVISNAALGQDEVAKLLSG